MFLLSLKVDLDVIPIFVVDVVDVVDVVVVVVVVVFIAFLDVSKLWSCLWFLFMCPFCR